MKTLAAMLVATAVLATASAATLQADDMASVITSVTEAKWGPAPPFIPAGAKIAVLSGNPMGTGAFAVRLRFPANYAIAAHSHPTDENVVVTAGALTLGMGDKLAKGVAGNKTLAVGGYALMPQGMNHYAYAGAKGADIVLYGMGPVEFKYVNPADDPRNAATPAK
jgi:quercetin dioxygenase-like cupin family protein